MSSTSITNQLTEQFARNIREGVWQVDQKIPTEMELMQRYKVGRNTIRAALQQLEKRQWIKATPGVGRSITPEALTTRGVLGMLIRGGELGAGQGGRFYNAAKAHARELGYQLATLHIDFERNAIVNNPADDGMLIDLKSLDSAIVYSRHYQNSDILHMASQMPVAAVMSHNIVSPNVYSHHIDYSAHLAKAVRYLNDTGIHHYAFVRYNSIGHFPFHQQLANSFVSANYLCDRPTTPQMFIDWKDDRMTSHEIYSQWASLTPRPQAIISAMDMSLVHLRDQFEAHDIPPRDRPMLICLADLTDVGRGDIAYFVIDIEKLAQDAVNSVHRNMTGQGPAWCNEVYLGKLVTHPAHGQEL
jgi:DNA-binding LacI/PurR family transcriptional regulator